MEMKFKFVNKIKKIYEYISVDGLLHILMSMDLLLLFYLFTNYILSLIFTIIIGVIKEIYDYFIVKSNNINQIKHDIVCDLLGIFIISFVLIIRNILNVL